MGFGRSLVPGRFVHSNRVFARKGFAASFRRCRVFRTTPTLAGLKCNPFACVEHLINHFCMRWVIERTDMIVAPNGSENLAEDGHK